ncbi:MAG: glycosyltransferase, partial [Gammaproteobacteria bacterium]
TVKIGVVAQLISRKGHEQLFSVLPELIAAHPNVEVLCFGQGPLQRELQDQIRNLALTDHVRLVGFRDDLTELLPELDCLVHPAQREGLGVAVLEAMSCGVPVVITAVGGLVDIVEHDVNGLLVAPDDDRALSAALRRIVQQRALRRRLGAAGRQRIEEAFSVDAMTKGNLAVYRQVLKGDDDGS